MYCDEHHLAVTNLFNYGVLYFVVCLPLTSVVVCVVVFLLGGCFVVVLLLLLRFFVDASSLHVYSKYLTIISWCSTYYYYLNT